jgi:hypothetical protein
VGDHHSNRLKLLGLKLDEQLSCAADHFRIEGSVDNRFARIVPKKAEAPTGQRNEPVPVHRAGCPAIVCIQRLRVRSRFTPFAAPR